MDNLVAKIGAVLGLLVGVSAHAQEEQQAQEEPQYILHPSWAPNGKTIAFYQRKGDFAAIRKVSLKRRTTELVTGWNAYDGNPSYNPDGGEIVFSRGAPDMQGQWDIMTLNLKTGDVRNLTNSPEREMHAQWSPDGKKISFVRFMGNQADVFVIDLASGSETNISNTPDAREFHPKWRADSGALVFDRSAPSGSSITAIDLSSGQERVIVTASDGARVSAPSYAPDGMSVVLSKSRGDANGIWQVSFADGGERHLLHTEDSQGAGGAVYSPDGSRIALHLATSGDYSLYVMNADGTGLKPIVEH